MRASAPMFAMFVAAASLAPVVASAGAWLPARGEYYNEVTAARGFSDTYFDSAGARFGLPFSERLESRALDFYSEIGWRKGVSLILAAPLRSVTDNYPDFRLARTETGFGDIDVGFRFKLRGGATALALQVDLIAPLGYQTSTFPSLGSGNQAARERLVFGTAIKPWNMFVEASGGYQSYFASVRSDVQATADAGVWLGPSLLVIGNYTYFTVLGGSDLASDDVRGQVVSPEIRYRVDDRLDVFVGSAHDWTGRNVYHQDQYYVGMAFRQTKLNRLQGLLGNKTRP
jgi:hypothetical protein